MRPTVADTSLAVPRLENYTNLDNSRYMYKSRQKALLAPAERSRPAQPERDLSGPALRTFFTIAGVWDLSVAEQMTLLGLTSRSTYYNWKKAGTAHLPKDTLERISYILGIFKDLQVLLPDVSEADRWVKKPNDAPVFGGRSALDRMLSGHVADLYVVRQYLDAQRGGWA